MNLDTFQLELTLGDKGPGQSLFVSAETLRQMLRELERLTEYEEETRNWVPPEEADSEYHDGFKAGRAEAEAEARAARRLEREVLS